MPRYLDYEGRKKLRAWIRGNFLGKAERAADAALLGGKPPEYYIQPMNLLDNSDFRNPVNQRGSAHISAQYGYPIDRWMYDKNGSGTGAWYDADNKYLYIANNATDGSWGALYHNVPAEKICVGTYTIAFHEKLIAPVDILCIVDDTTTVLTSAQYVPNDDGLVIATFNIQTAPNNKLLIAVYAEQGNTVAFDWAALYEGTYTADTLPPYVPRPYSVELAECRRWYLPMDASQWYEAKRLHGDNPRIEVPGSFARRKATLIGTPRMYLDDGLWYDMTVSSSRQLPDRCVFRLGGYDSLTTQGESYIVTGLSGVSCEL